MCACLPARTEIRRRKGSIMQAKLDVNSVYPNDEKLRRGLNTLGLFAIIAAVLTVVFAQEGGLSWIGLLIGTCILIIWSFAEAIVHFLRFYSIIISILLVIYAVFINAGIFTPI